MRILLITSQYPGYIGESRLKVTYAIHEFAKEWAKSNEVQVIRLWNYYPRLFGGLSIAKYANRYSDYQQFLSDGVLIHRIPIKKYPLLSSTSRYIKMAVKKISSAINGDFVPDVIVCHILYPTIFIGALLATKYSCKLVGCMHETDLRVLQKPGILKRFEAIDCSIDKIAQRSYKIQRVFTKIYKGSKSPKDFFVATSGVEHNQLISREVLEEKILKPNKTIISVCRLLKSKNVDILIEAFSNLSSCYGYKLMIVGDGPERAHLEKKIRDCNCYDTVELTGYLSKLEALNMMEKSEIFVMVSAPETFGLVYLEAMAKGCLVIGSKGEGIDGVIQDHENGFLCPPGNVKALEMLLETIVHIDISKRRRIINCAIETVMGMSNERMAEKYLNWIFS